MHVVGTEKCFNTFAQADSIIPPGVQGLDRYAYVNNSPMNYTDPSGHICVESDGDSDVGMAGNCGGGSNPNYRRGLQGSSSGWADNADDTDEEDLEIFGEAGHGMHGSPNIPELEEEENELWMGQQLIKFLGYLSDYEDIINSSKPFYKQVKYGFNTGPIEAITDGLLYGLDDRWSTSLTPSQRVWRVGVVAGQSYVVDRISDKVGVLGNALGKPGEIATQYLVSAYLSDFVVPTTTYYVFNTFNFGLPQNHKPVRLNIP